MPGAPHLELLRPLGQGGFGTVWLATLRGRDGFSRRVAVKVMRDAPSQPAEIIARQRDEARLLGLLQHPNIVQVLDLTELDGAPAVVMEHVEGVDVATLLKKYGALPASCVIPIASAIAAALDAGWNATSPETGRALRVIHRDIKPANVLVTLHGTVKVLDFGVARADFDREGRTQSMAFGTPRFMAPEQFLAGEVTPGNDVYALAVTTWEMLTGRSWERPPLAEEAFLAKVESQLPAVPDDFRSLLRGMMAWSTRSRPTAADVAAALDDMKCQGDTLRTWARRSVPYAMAAQEEAGNRVASQPPSTPRPPTLPPPSPTPPSSAPRRDAMVASAAGAPDTPPATPAYGQASPTLSGGVLTVEPTPAITGLAARRALTSPPASIPPTLDADSSLASPSSHPSDSDPGKLAIGAAGLVAGMALVGGLSLFVAGLWWWSTQTRDEATAEIAPTDIAVSEVGTEQSGQDPTATAAAAPESETAPAVGTAATTPPGPAATPTARKATATSPKPTDEATRRALDSLTPAPATETPISTPTPTTEAPVVTAPTPAPVPAPVAAPVPVPTKSLNFVADSIGWTVYLDGKSIGTTPVTGATVPYGSHQVRLLLDGNSAQKSFEVSATTAATLKYSSAKDMWTWQQ